VINTTHTKEPTGQSAKQMETPSLAELDMRDYFAAKAMQALLARPDSTGKTPAADYAKSSYMMADAMLEARK
jgi:hypothetical protein